MSNVYPELPRDDGENFRLAKSDKVLKNLESQIKHYEQVRKKYKRVYGILHMTGVVAGILGVTLSSAALGTSLTGIGIPLAIPVGAFGGISGLFSVACAAFSKKLASKVSKHEQTISLARSKSNTVQDLVGKALRDNSISDQEFSMILAEAEKYEVLKSELRQRNKANNDFKKENLYEQVKKELLKELSQANTSRDRAQ